MRRLSSCRSWWCACWAALSRTRRCRCSRARSVRGSVAGMAQRGRDDRVHLRRPVRRRLDGRHPRARQRVGRRSLATCCSPPRSALPRPSQPRISSVRSSPMCSRKSPSAKASRRFRSCGSPLRSRRSESRGRIWRCRCAGSVTAWSLRCRLLRSVLSYGTVSAVVGGLAMGVAASSAVHLIFGSGLGIPSRARIIAALEEMHLEVVDVEYLQRRNAAATVVRAQVADGGDVLVKVFGRDAADAAFASRLWRSIWYRDGGRTLAASSQQLAEHESLVLLVCERDGVPAHRLVGWSRASTGDTLIVARWLGGTLMSDMTGDDLDDATLDRVWRAVSDLHAAGHRPWRHRRQSDRDRRKRSRVRRLRSGHRARRRRRPTARSCPDVGRDVGGGRRRSGAGRGSSDRG